MTSRVTSDFRRWFWTRPRAHGDVIEGRRVSPIELLYDLVYVAVIAQSTHALGTNITLEGVLDFVVVFSLVWIGWINGTLYMELHGREDGRTRTYVFLQMAILCLLAVFTGNAAGSSGTNFALTYVIFLLVIGWLFFTVSRVDEGPQARVTKTYSLFLFGSAAAILVSALLPSNYRLVLWAAFDLLWIVGMLVLGARPRTYAIGIPPTNSLVERLDTFTLIVLGEVVVGVVSGLTVAAQEAQTIATGILALIIGLGFWWIYFDVVGGRPARRVGGAIGVWIIGRLPIVMAIAAAGAAMVGLVEHAGLPVTPHETAWLLAGAVAVVLLFEIVLSWSFLDGERQRWVYRPLLWTMFLGALLAVAIGFLPLAPWALALALNALLLGIWMVAALRFMKAGAWPPGSESVS
ncbi:MAG TPA: low temperature requirement protein A [Candidatus Limnocylindrales bacterium]